MEDFERKLYKLHECFQKKDSTWIKGQNDDEMVAAIDHIKSFVTIPGPPPPPPPPPKAPNFDFNALVMTYHSDKFVEDTTTKFTFYANGHRIVEFQFILTAKIQNTGLYISREDSMVRRSDVILFLLNIILHSLNKEQLGIYSPHVKDVDEFMTTMPHDKNHPSFGNLGIQGKHLAELMFENWSIPVALTEFVNKNTKENISKRLSIYDFVVFNLDSSNFAQNIHKKLKNLCYMLKPEK